MNHLEYQHILKEYRSFVDRFEKRGSKWIPTKEEWQRHNEVQRQLLLATLEQCIPGFAESEHGKHCHHYVPNSLPLNSFMEHIVAAIAYKEKQ